MNSSKELALVSGGNEVLPLGTTKEVKKKEIDLGTKALEGSSYGIIVGMGLSLSSLVAIEMADFDAIQGFLLAGVTFAGSIGTGGIIGYVNGKRKGIENVVQSYKPDYFYNSLKAIEKSSWHHVLPFKKSSSKIALTKDGKYVEEVTLVSKGKKVSLEYFKHESPGKAWDDIMDDLKTAYNITPRPKNQPVSSITETIHDNAPQSKGILTRIKTAWSNA